MKTTFAKYWFVWVLGAGAAVGGAAYYASHRADTAKAPATSTAVGANGASGTSSSYVRRQPLATFGQLPASAASAGRAPGCQFEAGKALSYKLSLTTDGTVDPKLVGMGASAPAATIEQSTDALLHLQTLFVESAASAAKRNGVPGAILLARLSDIVSTSMAHVDDVATPFLVRISERCEITGFARLRTTPKAAARTQQSIVHELAWRWPAAEAEEDRVANGIGVYLARFAFSQQPDGNLVQRTNLSYDELWNDSSVMRTFSLVPSKSLAHVRVGSGQWFASLSSWEVLSGDKSTTTSTTNATLVDTAPGTFDGLPRDVEMYEWENLLPQQFIVRESRPVTKRDLEAQAAVRHLTVQQSVAQYVGALQAGRNLHEAWPQLATYLEARPDATAPLMQMIAKRELSEETVPGAYIAMGRARTTQAREVLSAVVEDGGAPVIERTRAMFALTDRDDVGPSLAQTFSDLTRGAYTRNDGAARTLGREALLALGMLAGLQKDPEVTSIALAAINSSLARGGSGRTQRPAYGALANIGDVSLLPYPEKGSRDRDWTVRYAAAIVPRRLAPADSDALVGEWLARETEPMVRQRLYHTVYLQTLDSHQPAGPRVVAQAMKDLGTMPDVITRKSIVRILGTVAYTTDGAREVLMAQLPRELAQDHGIYGVVAKELKPEDVRKAVGL